MDCSVVIPSEETYEFIVVSDEAGNPLRTPECVQQINGRYAVWYYNRNGMPDMSVERYTYSAIPKCFGLVESTGLEISGILRLQNQSALSLKGQGVFVAVIDTGIRITDDAFRNSDGSTRIFSIWDQTKLAVVQMEEEAENESAAGPPEGFSYGVEYTREQMMRTWDGMKTGMEPFLPALHAAVRMRRPILSGRLRIPS